MRSKSATQDSHVAYFRAKAGLLKGKSSAKPSHTSLCPLYSAS
jgi:hypothetical protein